MALLVEEIVERGVGRDEPLQGLHPSEPLHGAFPSSEGQMAVLGALMRNFAASIEIARFERDRDFFNTIGGFRTFSVVGTWPTKSSGALARPGL